MSGKSSEITATDAADNAVVVAEQESWGGESFADLTDGADTTASRDVFTSADDKDELKGVPFVITGITFRPSDKKQGGDYVSCEATTKDDLRIVINDGSTGIRRQIAEYGQFKGWWKVPAEVPADSDAKSKFDLPVESWEFGEGVYTSFGTDAGLSLTVTAPVKLLAKKGLRRSDYDGPAGSATTFYLA